jgi:tetratricopeptide (TPR) repeat protein
LLALPFGAVAQQAESQPAVVNDVQMSANERAKELYLRGDRLYAEGDYEQAVATFEEAYRLSQRPALLYNMANALERLGRYEQALQRLNEYEPLAPDHQKHIVLKRIQALEQRAEEQRARERPAHTATRAPTPTTDDRAKVSPESAASVAEVKSHGRSSPILGFSLLGVGAVGIGVGTVFALAASGSHSDAKALCMDRPGGTVCPASAQGAVEAEKRSALLADISIGAGLVAAAVGVLLVLDLGGSKESATMVSVTPMRSGGRLNLVRAF